MSVRYPILAFSLAIMLAVPLRPAVGETDENKPVTLSQTQETFILGNVLFALLHEFGHAIIAELQVPMLGLEENSADTIAAVSLIWLDRQDPAVGFSSALASTALVQAYVWETGVEREQAAQRLWAQHELSAQRFARLVCLLYGSDPDRFRWFADAAKMDEIRADGCEAEWASAERAGIWLRANFGVPGSNRDLSGDVNIDVKYGPPGDATEAAMLELLQRRRVLEQIATYVGSNFAFPEPLTLKLSRCHVANAYWDAEYREVTLCYELMTEFMKFANRTEVAQLMASFEGAKK